MSFLWGSFYGSHKATSNLFLRSNSESKVTQCPTLCDPMDCTRLLCPWDFPGKSTGVGFHFLLQGIFLTQASNPGLLHCRQTLYPLSHQGSLVSMTYSLKYLFIWLYWVLVVACGIQFPDQESNLGPLHWEHGVLASRPQEESLFPLPVKLSKNL